jgi:hypothetical protein
MLVQEVVTRLEPGEVVRRAREFFTLRFSPYAGFITEEGDAHIRFRFEVGELVIGVGSREGARVVRGSTSRLHHELSQFLTTLSFHEEVRQNLVGPGTSGAG